MDKNEVAPPSQPHLGIMTQRGDILPLKIGTVMLIIEKANNIEGIFPIILREVSHRKLVFDAVSSDKSSTRRVTFTADWSGDFKSWFRTAKRVNEGNVKEVQEEAYNPDDYLGNVK